MERGSGKRIAVSGARRVSQVKEPETKAVKLHGRSPRNRTIMNEESCDANSDGNVIYQESMPSYLSLELPGAIRFSCLIMILFVVMLSIWGLISLLIFGPEFRDPFTFIYTLLGGVALSLFFGLGFMLATFARYFKSDCIMIKYVVLNDRIIVSNISTGMCIFNFRFDEISFVESTFPNSRYLFNYWGELCLTKRIFVLSDKRCLLISSPCDQYKQRIPIGYSEEMRLELKNFLLGKTIAPFLMPLVERNE